MDLNKLTLKSQEALQGAQQISQAQQQNVVDVLHLFYVLLGQAESIVPTIISKLEIDNKKLKEKVIDDLLHNLEKAIPGIISNKKMMPFLPHIPSNFKIDHKGIIDTLNLERVIILV